MPVLIWLPTERETSFLDVRVAKFGVKPEKAHALYIAVSLQKCADRCLGAGSVLYQAGRVNSTYLCVSKILFCCTRGLQRDGKKRERKKKKEWKKSGVVKTCELLELLRCWRTRLETIGRGKWLHCVGVVNRGKVKRGRRKKKEGGRREEGQFGSPR